MPGFRFCLCHFTISCVTLGRMLNLSVVLSSHLSNAVTVIGLVGQQSRGKTCWGRCLEYHKSQPSAGSALRKHGLGTSCAGRCVGRDQQRLHSAPSCSRWRGRKVGLSSQANKYTTTTVLSTAGPTQRDGVRHGGLDKPRGRSGLSKEVPLGRMGQAQALGQWFGASPATCGDQCRCSGVQQVDFRAALSILRGTVTPTTESHLTQDSKALRPRTSVLSGPSGRPERVRQREEQVQRV